MQDRPRGGLAALCIAQTTSWGLLYYSLPVAVPPIADDTGWSHTAITAALTFGLIVSAIAGLRVGKLLNVNGPRRLMTVGSLIGVVALLMVAWSPNLAWFYIAWLIAGLAQSAVLYPPAFAVITRWYGPQRIRPLTTLTLVAGFASTIFAPIVAYLIDQFGWRVSYVIMAVILGVVTVPLHIFFLGADTRSVLTAHRGLPEATLFNDLDEAAVGDTFTVTVFDEVLTYQIVETEVIEPDETEAILPIAGHYMVTLITCTPLGINTHRILANAERISPTPEEDIEAALNEPELPGFPWWAVILGGVAVGGGLFVWRSGTS